MSFNYRMNQPFRVNYIRSMDIDHVFIFMRARMSVAKIDDRKDIRECGNA